MLHTLSWFELISVLDVNECSEESSPCDSETETCQNLMGSYICKCREGLVKSTDGSCIPEEDLPPEVKPKKPKKKKKSKKGKADSKEEEGSQRPQYPWYYTIGPLTLLFLVKKFCQPNIVTSAGLILFVVVSAKLSPQAWVRLRGGKRERESSHVLVVWIIKNHRCSFFSISHHPPFISSYVSITYTTYLSIYPFTRCDF